MSPADPNIAGQATNQQPARQPLSRAREAITMTRPRPGRRSPSPASTPPRALAILGLLLLSLFTSARASRNTGHLGFHDLGRPFEKTLYRKDDPKRGQLK